MKNILWQLIKSFDNEKGGFSARKLSAFVAINIAIYSTYRFGSNGNLVECLLVWLAFALLCLGIITMEHIIKFKNGDKE